MARAKTNNGATAKMYRHFAVITVMLTAGVAVFSDSDNQENMQASMIARESAARDAGKDVKKYGEPKLVNKFEESRDGPQQRTSGSFDESVPDFGVPMDSPGGGGTDSSYVPENLPQHRRMAVPSGYNVQYGISEEELEKLTPEQRKRLLEQIKKARYGESPEKREAEIAALMERSRSASGSSSELID